MAKARDSVPERLGLGLRLALVFVGVSLAVVGSVAALIALTLSRQASQLVRQQQADLARAVAVASAAAYDHDGWAHAELAPVIDLADRTGVLMRVRDAGGRVVRSSPGFSRSSPVGSRRLRIVVRGRRVGSIEVRYGGHGIGPAIQQFVTTRWQIIIGAAGTSALLSLLVALVVSRRITSPVDKLIYAVRARGKGHREARAGEVGGFVEIRELAVAFDQMADTMDQQDRVRRNLVADVAHELRTPIAVLQSGHEAMLDEVTAPTSEQLASLHDEVLRLARMVDNLRRLASAEAAALQLTVVPCDLAATVEPAADSLADSYDAASISLVRRLSPVEAMCDPPRVYEIALNLLGNAMKFTSAGGSVVLETWPDADQAGEVARLRVSDTGVGIAPDDLSHVSERFFRGRGSAGTAGTGVGLTIVAELVRAHHGTMDIASEPGTGTQVTITLPAAGDHAPGHPAADSTPLAG